MKKLNGNLSFIVFLGLVFIYGAAHARAKLAALPERAKVVINLENPHYNLVEEERILTLDKGHNQIDFSWQGVSISHDSILFMPVADDDSVTVLSTSFPPEGNALIWNIHSKKAGEVRIRISYLLNGLSRKVSYEALTEPDEKSMAWRSYFKLMNRSGENFENAEIFVGYGSSFERPIANQESRKMLSYKIESAPVVKVYKYDSNVSEKVRMFYRVKNDSESALGNFLLRGGKVRIFQKDSAKGSVFLGEDWSEDTPVGEKMDLFIGNANDINIKRFVMSTKNEKIRRDSHKRLVLYDQVVSIKYEIENFKEEPVSVKLFEKIKGYWKKEECDTDYTRKDAETAMLTFTVPPKGEKTTLYFVYRIINNMHDKQLERRYRSQ